MESPTSTTKKITDSVAVENGPPLAANDATDLEALDYLKGSDPDSPSHAVLRELYQSYLMKQRRPGLVCFLFASILFDLWVIVVPQGQSIVGFGITGAVLVFNLCMLIFIGSAEDGQWTSIAWKYIPAITWVLAIAQISLYSFLETFITTRDILGWWILLCFLVIVTIPIPDILSAYFYTANFFLIMFFVLMATIREVFCFEQILAMTFLTAPAALIGVWAYGFWHCKQKRAFIEAKKSLEVKMVMEEQSAEQERLLLSVLPEHVAVKMRQDLGSTNSEQFKKIYMSRHENVSILYADIVGFTAISSTYSAQDLVKMLNELFARFDRLAEKYQQLRIKILGDCYYCISGAPVERPDHAVLCVHMGLSMVKAIKYVQQKTNSPVDMRVGIHTGAILAGILGQRQWQFDVYSKDVELANKMESSGKAGRVHISEKTLSFLNGEFEVEPAYGEKREEALRIAGLKTYFITKVLKPFSSPSNPEKNGSATANHTLDAMAAVDESPTEVIPDEDSKANSQEDDMNAAKLKAADDFKHRLRKELISRDGHKDLHKDTNIFLTFKNAELESAYSSHREPFSSCPLVAFIMIELFNAMYSTQILPVILVHYILIIIPTIFITLLVIISVAESCEFAPPSLVKLSKKFNDTLCLRRIAAMLIITFSGGFHLIDVYNYSHIPALDPNIALNLTSPDRILSHRLLEELIYPSFLTHFSVLILISVAIIAQLSHICKIAFMFAIAALQFAINILFLGNHFKFEEQLVLIGLPTRYNVSSMLFVVTLALSFLSRYMDKEDRVIFKWKTEVAEQKEKVSDMRRRNEALVYNVLPVHVAEHFMKNKKRSHDDLYSQSYAEVGVLFASMPNFTDFYSEETVNNQGLECLRFLNEVISDYDALLELPQFQDIIKIKTIGSTYMAASGLNPSRQVKPDDPIIIRWAHLALLVEFALELKKALQGINEQSFNHFVLKMGINHGPITAGVIGARKPHYDIWGNTVNVASRMESTGKAGAIQVTEETCQILQTFGYTFEQRGLVPVKGKGQLMTYYLQGKAARPNAPSSPIALGINTMEPVMEVEEPSDSPKKHQASTDETTKTTTVAISANSEVTESSVSTKRKEDSELHPTDDVSATMDTTSVHTSDIRFETRVNGNSSNQVKSPKNHNNAITDDMLALSSTLDQSFERVEQLTSSALSTSATVSNRHHNGLSSSDVELDVDAKTPLLNMNSTNLDCRDYNGSEKDSLIEAQ